MSTFPIKVAVAGLGITGVAGGGIYYLVKGNTKTATKASTNSRPILDQ